MQGLAATPVPDGTSTYISVDVLKLQCETVISYIEKERELADKSFVLRKMGRKNRVRKFFRMKPLTYHDVEKRMGGVQYYYKGSVAVRYPSNFCYTSYNAAKRLLRVCEILKTQGVLCPEKILMSSIDILAVWGV